MAFYEARGTQQGYVVGAKVLKGTVVGGTALHPQLILGLDNSVCPERLLLLVSLKVPGTQRYLTLEASLHSQQLLIYAMVAENLHLLGLLGLGLLGLRLPVKLWCGGSETLDDAVEFEVFLQGFHTMILLAALWATWKSLVILVDTVGLPDTSSTVVMATGEDHRIRVELKADGTAQLVG